MLPGRATRSDVGKVRAELLPPHGNEIGADEGQQRVAPPRAAAAEQKVGLIYAVDCTIVRDLAARYARDRWEKVHDREHRVR